MPKPDKQWLWGSATHVSGPVSVAVFRNMYLFGDMHFDYDNECSGRALRAGGTTLYDVMSRALSEHPEARVYVEYPVSDVRVPKKNRWYFERLETLLQMDASWTAKVGAVLSGVLGVPQPVIGEFGKFHERLPQGTDRVIPIDIRSDPNVHAWESLHRQRGSDGLKEAFLTPALNAGHFQRWLRCYIHSADFIAAVRRIFKDHPLATHFTGATLVQGRHAIREQYLKLTLRDRHAVSDFFDVKIEEMVGMRSQLVKPGALASVQDVRDTLQMMLSIVMDMYAICILLRTWHEGNAVLVYCGNFHVTNYKQFFEAYTGHKPDKYVKMSQLPGNGGVNRCLKL